MRTRSRPSSSFPMSRAERPRAERAHARNSLAVLTVGTCVALLSFTPRALAASPVPREPVRSQAAVSFDIMADLYRLRLDGAAGQCAAHCQTLRTQLAEQLRTLFDARYRFVVWSRSAGAPAPKDTVCCACDRLEWASRSSWNCDWPDSARARMYGVVPVSIPFEQYYNAAIRPPGEWAPSACSRVGRYVARGWTRRRTWCPMWSVDCRWRRWSRSPRRTVDDGVRVSPDSLRVSPDERVGFTIRLNIRRRCSTRP